VPLMTGVGEAFDFITGTAKQAPTWVQENGLEWSLHVPQELRKLWQQYLIMGSGFVWIVSQKFLGLKKLA
jgi:N-acetylglucosaminyldiphosphoundecaprenol N-acetyl-beta-D-mannosaminyltransferase